MNARSFYEHYSPRGNSLRECFLDLCKNEFSAGLISAKRSLGPEQTKDDLNLLEDLGIITHIGYDALEEETYRIDIYAHPALSYPDEALNMVLKVLSNRTPSHYISRGERQRMKEEIEALLHRAEERRLADGVSEWHSMNIENIGGVPANSIKSLLYPACGKNAFAVVEMLKRFPLLERIQLVDNFHHTNDYKRETIFASFIDCFCMHGFKTVSIDREEALFRHVETGREVRVNLLEADYLNLAGPIRDFEDGFDMVMVRYPGYGGELTDKPHYNNLFYRNVCAHTKDGGYIYIAHSKFLDMHDIDGQLRVVDFKLDGRKEVVKAALRDRTILYPDTVLNGEFVVLQLTKPNSGLPVPRVQSVEPAQQKGKMLAGAV